MSMPGTVTTPGQPVAVVDGVYRGRFGKVCGAPDSTNSIRVMLDKRSAYDALRPAEFAWIPVDYLNVRG